MKKISKKMEKEITEILKIENTKRKYLIEYLINWERGIKESNEG